MPKLLTFFFAVVFLTGLQAQEFEGYKANEKLQGSELLRIHSVTGKIQYALLSESSFINESQVSGYFSNVYGLKQPSGLKVIKRERDELGFEHIRFQQLYNGIPVYGAVLIAHMKDGRLHSFNGEVFDLDVKNSKAGLDEKACLQKALDSFPAELYMWQDEQEERIIREIREDDKATWYPAGELVFCARNLDFSSPHFFLAYRFTIHASIPRKGENIYINAQTGEVLARENLIHTTDVPGKAITKYSGTQNIITDSTAPYNYRLRENTRGNGIYTFNMKKGTSYGAAVDFKDSNNIWNNVNASKDEVATDAHWGAETTYDYFKNRHNRNSYNNNNARINSYVHFSNNYDNAFWDGVRMTYGDGNSFKPLTSLDVCGHEIAHAVTSNSAGLIYSYESGQLNESFSDIFGNAVERYGKPSNYSWIIGEEITYDGTGLRNMFNPKLKGHPRCYKSTNWYFGSGDNGGVHLNSGVQNWWFYLVSEGGAGTNDVSNAYKVDSLGIQKAEKIAYRNLTVYLTPTSQYADARFYSIRAAVDLYGNCSKEVITVTNAWYACNVGAKYDSGFVKADFVADTVVCHASRQVKFTNLSTNSSSAKWYFGDGSNTTTYNPIHTYSGYGNFTIKLVATSCFKNRKDSLTKTAYVKVDSSLDICNAVILPSGGVDSTNKCQTFVYDEGGEGNYKNQRTTLYRLSAPGSDSLRIRFLDFDYEAGYDSLYIYKGAYPGGIKIGGYTGSTLPFGGKNFAIAGSVVTLRHVADPGVVGRGFKLYYTAFKKPVDVTAFADTTICKGTSTLLYGKGTGGYKQDYVFQWKNIKNDDSIIVAPQTQTVYKLYLRDACTGSRDSAEVTVKVRDELKVSVNPDTIVCRGQSVALNALASGGKNTSYQFGWNNGLSNQASHVVSPLITTSYRIILNDGCTPEADTAYVTIYVKDALKVKLSSSDTVICYNRLSSFTASGSGGDTSAYVYTWNAGLGTGTTKSVTLSKSAWIRVILDDGCTSDPASDSVFIRVRPELKVSVGRDTTLCKGNSIKLVAAVSGGDASAYNYQWNQGLPSGPDHVVQPGDSTVYKVTVNDLCSDAASDSVVVAVLPGLHIDGLADTTICYGSGMTLNAIASGGKTGNYTYAWNNGLPDQSSHTINPLSSGVYTLILSDGCTVRNDTASINISVKDALKADIQSPDTLICYNKSTRLTVSGTGGLDSAYVFDWDNGLGQGTDKSINLKTSAWLHVRLSDACTPVPGLDSIFIKVREKLEIDLNKDSVICYGSGIQLKGAVKGGDPSAYTYQWSHGLSPAPAHTVSPVTRTVYKAVLKDNCSDDATDSVLVDVLPPIKINNLRDTLLCFGGTATLAPVVSGGKPLQYQYIWDNGLGNSPMQYVGPQKLTSYTLEVKDNCSSPSAYATVKIDVRAPLSIGLKLSRNEICAGDSTLMDVDLKGGIPASYKWTVNGVDQPLKDIYLSPSATTGYSVKLFDNCSWDADTGFSLVVNPLPIVDFVADDTVACTGQPVSFSNLSANAETYEWDFGDGIKSVLPEPVHRYKASGYLPVELTAVSQKGCRNTLERNPYIHVWDHPESLFSFNAVSVTYDHPLVNFTNQSKYYSTFEWHFGDGMSETVADHPSHMYGDTGHFLVLLISRNAIGCSDTFNAYVTVKDIYRLFIPTAISVNEDGINDDLKIGGRGITGYKVRIFNRWGEMVFVGTEKDKPFNGKDSGDKHLPKGSYVLTAEIRDHEGRMHYIRQVLQIL